MIDTHGVEMRNLGEFIGQVGITANAAAISKHINNAAILSVADLFLIGQF